MHNLRLPLTKIAKSLYLLEFLSEQFFQALSSIPTKIRIISKFHFDSQNIFIFISGNVKSV